MQGRNDYVWYNQFPTMRRVLNRDSTILFQWQKAKFSFFSLLPALFLQDNGTAGAAMWCPPPLNLDKIDVDAAIRGRLG